MIMTVLDSPGRAFEPREAFPLTLTPLVTKVAGTAPEPVQVKPRPKIAYLVGSDLNDHIVHDASVPIFNQGSTDCDDLRVTGKTDFWRIHVTRSYFRQAYRYSLDEYDCLLNLVTDADQHSRVLRNLVRLLDGVRGRIINHPAKVLASSREQIARRSAGIANVRVPRTIRLVPAGAEPVRRRLEAAGLAFPVLARLPGRHGGQFVGMFGDAEAMTKGLQRNAEYIVTEFVDYAGSDGLYRKYRVFLFGGRRVFRHMLVADHWNVHADNGNAFMLDRPTLRDEERRLFAEPDGGLGPSAVDALEAIGRAVDLDFMGIDFGFMRDGRLLLFEANATMNFFPFVDDPRFAYRRACLRPAQQAFEAMLGLA